MENKDLAIIGLGVVAVSLSLEVKRLKKRRELDDTEAQAVIDTIFKNIVKDYKK
jgi:hypothetical protein